MRYPFFASHKKSHTRFGDASAGAFVGLRCLMMDLLCVFVEIVCLDLARATKDIIKLKANLEGYFDAGTDLEHDFDRLPSLF